ncbi:delta(1)-pyrroline-2-carboxylate reductase family protein [Noviherbaspirillum cavernae]|uniref:Delta(1)-pyrroline-2-carboxylate reductase family protein n=1 Tax=Noviherbaspirillum cavernae TaxID=2320862 RepID=A0A418WWX6_9BURK|nr:delta(1)-pyrroline-2-carboxylate reductase family protein [Noviherbaspirillum cavernae]RJG04691.1 delta(1)-pyrroline-2-carboxylate reductase family protein [Noviherbaspirillum cavernae]
MQILNPTQTAQALPYAKLVPAVAEAARQLASGEIHAPDRMVVTIDAASVLLCMPALGADIGVTKLITVHNNNAQHSLPVIQGEVVVFDTATGRRRALLDGPTVTARRTAAVTLLGIQQLAPAAPASAILIGTGVQAAAHADALAEFFGITDLRIASRDAAKAQPFCDALSKRHPALKVRPVASADLARECASADVVVALTTAKSPVIPAQLPATTLAVGVGAFKPDMVEFPPELLHARQIVVDHIAGAQHEAGDLIQAKIAWDKVRDLSSVVAHGMPQSGVAPVLKTVGHAAWDLAAARVAVQSLAGG